MTKIDIKSSPKSEFERLEWIEVRNFRAFRLVKIDELTDINIFIGKNNTGKSTLLEAIYLNLTKNRKDLMMGRLPLAFILNRRGIYRFILDDPNICLSYLVNDPTSNIVSFSSNLDEYLLQIFDRINIPKEILENLVNMLNRIPTAIRRRYENPFYVIADSRGEVCLAIFETMYRERINYIPKFFPSFIPRKGCDNVVFVDEYLLRESYHAPLGSFSVLSNFILKLERYSEVNKYDLIKSLSHQLEMDVWDIVPRISDIFIEISDGRYIPFSLLGDGTKVFLTYYYALNLKNSYILLEEPENHLHPSLMSKCIELIVESSKFNQVFITTHSLEFLQKILEIATEQNANLKVFAFRSLRDGIPEIDIYDLDEAESAVNEIGVDLR